MRPDPLLDVIFQPGEESLRRALAAARFRRIRRVVVPTVTTAACLVIAILLLKPTLPQNPLGSPSLRPATVEIIRNMPLLPREIVRTSPQSVEVISTSISAAAAPALVADSELLASFAGGRAALVGGLEDRRVVEF